MKGKQVTKGVGMALGKAGTRLMPVLNLATVVHDLYSYVAEYRKVKEQETTKRKTIEAWEKVILAKIKAQRDIVMEYLDKSFDERKQIFNALFDKLDRALARGDIEALTLILDSMVGLAKDSPLKILRTSDEIKAFLEDPNAKIEF